MEIGGRKLGAQSQVNDILGNAVYSVWSERQHTWFELRGFTIII